jgi:DNA-binding ferritin-like protein
MGPRAHDRTANLSAPVRILQTELCEVVELALQIQHTKWSLVREAPEASTRLLADIVTDAWHRADRVAEELRTRGTAPDARIRTIASNPSLYPTPGGWLEPEAITRIGNALGRSATWARERGEELDDEPDLAHLLTAIGSDLDKWAGAVRDVSTR